MATSQKARLIEGPIAKTLVRMTLPMIMGVLGAVLFNLIDTYFVSQLGTLELAAMSFTFPIVMILASFSMGLGVGTSVVVSRAIGEGNLHMVRRLTTDSLILSVLLVGGFVVIGLFTIDLTFGLMGATPELLPLIREYMEIWYLGMVALVVPMVGNNVIRATGDTKTPSLVMLIAVVVNSVLDPLLIFGIGPFPRLELAGAAITTVFSRTTILCFSLWVLHRRERLITFEIPRFEEILNSWKQILFIGLPAAGTNIILPLASGIIIKLLSIYGEEAIAAFGVASRIEMFTLVVVPALASVLSPFVGQNLGAKKYDRAKLSVKYSQQFVFIWGGILAVLLAVIAKPLALLFSDNSDVVSTIVAYFWILPISYGLQGILKISTTVFSVLKKPYHSAMLPITQTFVLYIPLAYLGSIMLGLKGIFGAATISYIMMGFLSYLWLKKTLDSSSNITDI